jgi:hypothetical protein
MDTLLLSYSPCRPTNVLPANEYKSAYDTYKWSETEILIFAAKIFVLSGCVAKIRLFWFDDRALAPSNPLNDRPTAL